VPAAPAPAPAPTRRRPVLLEVLTAPFSPRTWVAQIHVTWDLAVGTILFGFVVTAAAVLAAAACTVVLIPVVLWIVLLSMRVVGVVERARYAVTLGVGIPDPYPTFTGEFWDRVRQRFFSAAPWRELGYAVVLFPLALVGFVATTTSWATSLALAALPAYLHLLPGETARFGLFDVGTGTGLTLATAAGVAGLFLTPWVCRGWAALDVFVARNLLGRGVTAELEDRVDVLETTRNWALEVAEAERRRIERDLHDGAQQRLVALAMELGMARQRLDRDDAEGARELIDKAHEDAKAAIAELRDLARGIHPPDLGETGLPGAIPVLAGRSTVPVEVEVSVPERPAPSIEGIAYFVVSECLANVAKHARASRAAVRVVQQGQLSPPGRGAWLVIEVGDDGAGGAATDGPGSGLRGLADRVASVDGRFTVSSPAGGPTVIRAELPCVS
jgi:signal transduction histidine kinase